MKKKQVLFQEWGLSSFRKNNERMLHIYSDTQSGESGAIGTELESTFSPTITRARELNVILKKKGIHSKDMTALLENIRVHILNQCSPLLYCKPVYERPLTVIELKLSPISMKGYKNPNIREEIEKIMTTLKFWGFTDSREEISLQPNLDVAIFGSNITEIKATIEKFLWFIFNNVDFFNCLSFRMGSYQKNSDMYALLGDPLANLSHENRVKEFIKSKNSLLEVLYETHTTERRALSMTINSNAKRVIELRYFGTKLDTAAYFVVIEFSHALAKFCLFNSLENCTLQNFCLFIDKNKSEYSELYYFLTQGNNYCVKYFT